MSDFDDREDHRPYRRGHGPEKGHAQIQQEMVKTFAGAGNTARSSSGNSRFKDRFSGLRISATG